MQKFIAYLRLMRPANIVTSVADILLGFAASGAVLYPIYIDRHLNMLEWKSLLWLVLSTIGLYGGGVVFNDVFDAELDKIERPERPIPSGIVSKVHATILGIVLLMIGVDAALQVSYTSAAIAISIAILALVYDGIGKHHTILGPINMGACRGGNLLLGISVIPFSLLQLWYIAFIPIIYISAITMISRGEVHGGSKIVMKAALGLYLTVISAVLILSYIQKEHFPEVFPFLMLFSYFIFPPLFKALKDPQPKFIGAAVKAGVISLIVLDATLAAGFAGWIYGLMVLALLPISRLLAKTFAVT